MKKAAEHFYGSLDTELISNEDKTYRIAKGGLIDETIKIAYIEGVRMITGYGMMDIKKAIKMCVQDLSKKNFNKQIKSIHRFRI